MTETYKIRRTKLINISFVLSGYATAGRREHSMPTSARFSRAFPFHAHRRRFPATMPLALECAPAPRGARTERQD